MISAVDLNLANELVSSEDPPEVVWRRLTAIWRAVSEYASIQDYYKVGEELTEQLETFLNNVYFEFYNELIAQADRYLCSKSLLFSEAKTVIIVDGMSVREFFLLAHELNRELGYRLVSLKRSFSALPPITEAFVERLFGKRVKPSQLPGKMNKARFVYVSSEQVSLPLYPGKPLMLWLPFPDVFFTTPRSIGVESMYRKTRDLLFTVLKEYEPSRVAMTSDHGYILSKNLWRVRPKVTADLLRDVFGDVIRYAGVKEVEEKLEDIKSLTVRDESYVYVQGRYTWSRRRRVGYHGGISLTEVMIPLGVFEK